MSFQCSPKLLVGITLKDLFNEYELKHDKQVLYDRLGVPINTINYTKYYLRAPNGRRFKVGTYGLLEHTYQPDIKFSHLFKHNIEEFDTWLHIGDNNSFDLQQTVIGLAIGEPTVIDYQDIHVSTNLVGIGYKRNEVAKYLYDRFGYQSQGSEIKLIAQLHYSY